MPGSIKTGTRKRCALIVNPASGQARSLARTREAIFRLTRRGAVVSLHETAAAGDARRLASDLCDSVDVIVSIGGDGTLNEVVNGVFEAGSSTPIAVVPAGTANVVAKELGLPKSLGDLVSVIMDGPLRGLDLGLAGKRPFTMCAGVGFDAAIVDAVSRERSKSGITMLSYTIPAMTALLKYDFPKMKVVVDEETVTDDATFVIVGNMRRYGGPFRFFQEAVPDDGLLDIVCLHGRNQIDMLRYGIAVFQDSLSNHEDVDYHQGTSISIDSEREVLVQVDGDCGGSLPMRFEILPAAIQFCVGELDPHGESARLPDQS